MFAVVYVPNFALQSLLRHEPELRERPVALIDTAGAHLAKTFVLECTRAAEAAGVSPGLTAPQAQARCKELVLKLRSTSAEQSAAEILLQTAYTFSPNIENTAPGVCTIDLRGLNFETQNPKPETDQSPFTSTVAHDNSAQQSFRFSQDAGTRSPSPLNGEREGVRGDWPIERCSRDQRHETYHPSPSIPLPVEGRGKPNCTLAETWCAAIIAALRQLGLEAHVGIATTPNIALLAARAASPVLLIEDVSEFFSTLPIAALEPTPQVLGIMKRWGVHTAGAFLALGKEAIAERLGAEALELFHRASTQTIRPLNIIVPADTFEEQMEFEVQVETIEPLLFVLRRFIEQLSARIALTYRVVAELNLTLTLESGAPYERSFKIPAPTANVETLFRMLHTHLENLRTDAPITSLKLSATPTRVEGQQFGLFESALRDPNHFHETLARLTAFLGEERVGMPVAEPTHRPDAFQMKTPEFGDSQTRNSKLETRNSATGLCLRRFRPAILADVELKDGRPAFISSLNVNGRIVKKPRGPWCISGTWWDERRWARQEWDVETSDGAVYRLFYTNGNWSVEGVYD